MYFVMVVCDDTETRGSVEEQKKSRFDLNFHEKRVTRDYSFLGRVYR